VIPRFLEIAAELDGAQRNMRELGYSQADIEDEMERIRARHWGKPDPYVEAARLAKARKIALTIWRGLDDGARRDARTGWLLQEAGESFRQQFARLAGCNDGCSGATWKMVVQDICGLVTAERRNQADPCGICDEGEAPLSGGARCPRCLGTGKDMCANCGEQPATVVTPLGLYCAPCAPEALG
jgi:hypothetical protein